MKSDKRIFAGTAVLALLFGLVLAGCASKPVVSENGLYEYMLFSFLDAKSASITQYFGTASDVVIPGHIDGNPVGGIGDLSLAGSFKSGKKDFVGVFEGKSLTGVVFPDTLKTFGKRAFANNKLTSVTLSDNVSVGESAFAGNPVIHFTLGEGISCYSADSLLALTPYYYGNDRKPGRYIRRGGAWEYNGSACDKLPAMIKVPFHHDLTLTGLDGEKNILLGVENEYRKYSIGSEHWIPAGTHTLRIGKRGSGTVASPTGGGVWELQGNFEAGLIYEVKEREDKKGVEIEVQGPWSPPQE